MHEGCDKHVCILFWLVQSKQVLTYMYWSLKQCCHGINVQVLNLSIMHLKLS